MDEDVKFKVDNRISAPAENMDQEITPNLPNLESSARQDPLVANAAIEVQLGNISREIKKLSVEVSECRKDLSGKVSVQSNNVNQLSRNIAEVKRELHSLRGDLSEALLLLRTQGRASSCVNSDQKAQASKPRAEEMRCNNHSNKPISDTGMTVISETAPEVPCKNILNRASKQSPSVSDVSDSKRRSYSNEVTEAKSSDGVDAGLESKFNPIASKADDLEKSINDSDCQEPKDALGEVFVSRPLESLPNLLIHTGATNEIMEYPNYAKALADSCSAKDLSPNANALDASNTETSPKHSKSLNKSTRTAAPKNSHNGSSASAINFEMGLTTCSTPPGSTVSTTARCEPSVSAPSVGSTYIEAKSVRSDSCSFSTTAPTPTVPISLLPPEEVHRYRNSVLIQKLMPEALQTLLRLLSHHKPAAKSWLWCVKYKTNLSITQLKDKYHFSALEIQALQSNDMSDFDVTLLVKLIKISADIVDCNHSDSGHSDTSVGCILWKLKNFRNMICHKIKTSSTSADIFDQVKKSLFALFVAIGSSKLNIDSDELQDHVLKLDKCFESVASTENERRCIERQYIFEIESLKESQSYWSVYCTVESVPFTCDVVDREKVFHPMEIYTKEISSTGSISAKESYRHILKRACDDGRKATVLVGEAGSGKTTVVKNIALQFLGLIESEIDFLKEIHLLLFLECRDRTTDTLQKAMSNNFPKACRKVSAEGAIESFCFLGNLIIIDGYDEVNESSSKVINQLLRLVKAMSYCQILFTTRPHKASQLKELLTSNGILFTTYELVPLTEEQEQLQFLHRYEQNMSNANPLFLGMAETYKALLPEVKQFFVYPINLILFYFLYCNSRDTISNWETSNDVIEQMLVLYEKFIARKLLERHFDNLNRFIREALEEIYQFAFRCISENKIMLSSDDMKPVHKCLEDKFAEWELKHKLDTTVVTSIVFLAKTVPNPACPVVYQFYHKGIQEIMAARTFVKLLKKETDLKLEGLLFPGSLGHKPHKKAFARYSNVLLFVMSYLSQPSNHDTLQDRKEELCQFFISMGIDVKYCSEVILCKPRSQPLIDLGVSLIKSLDYFTLEREREYLAMAVIFPHYQPKSLKIFHREKSKPPVSMQDLLLLLKDNYIELDVAFVNSFWTFDPVDSIVKDIMPSKCTLTGFSGCLETEEGMRSLALQMNLCDEPLYVHVSTVNAHHLKLLSNYRSSSEMRVRYEDYSSTPIKYQLPSGQPTLRIAHTGGGERLLDMISSLAPDNREFTKIILEECSLNKADLQKLIYDLEKGSIWTSIFPIGTGIEVKDFWGEYCMSCNARSHKPGHQCVELHVKKII